MLQCAVWNTWGPIASSIMKAYPSIDSKGIAGLALWGPGTVVAGTPLFMLILQKYGQFSKENVIKLLNSFFKELCIFMGCAYDIGLCI